MATPNVDDAFEAYFRRADLDGDGLISGAEAVSFFAGSGLSNSLLAQIWDFTNESKRDYLIRAEFFNALKLVTVAQSKRELTPRVVKAALYGLASSKIPAPQISFSPTVASPQGFSSLENGLTSGPAADFSDVPSFVSSLDYTLTSGATGAYHSNVRSFVSSVDNAVMSGTGTYLSNVPSFVSSVDNAMMSGIGAAYDSNNVRSFVSSVEDAMGSGTGGGGKANTDLTSLSDLGIARADAGHRAHVIEGFQFFTMAEVVAATNNFSPENKIGAGDSGAMYKAKLANGREVAIKSTKAAALKTMFYPEFIDNSATYARLYDLYLAFLSRLNHKNLVKLVGLCEVKDVRLLVYEYNMRNGSLYDNLHNVEKGSNTSLNSWKMRIQIALDASRGIVYLHYFAVHMDIKSSNILLDDDWTARVSDSGLSLVISPFHLQNVLAEKSDVYGLGIVLLELLTGKEATLEHVQDGDTTTTSVVEFSVPVILDGELDKILDPRLGAPELKNEAEALKLVAYTAMNCVKFEKEDRPTIADVVANLERALAILDSDLDELN